MKYMYIPTGIKKEFIRSGVYCYQKGTVEEEKQSFILTKNRLSTRINSHPSSSNNPNNLPLPVGIHNRSFNSCWNLHVLHNLPPNTTTHGHLELYQFILSSIHSLGINFRELSFLFSSTPAFFMFLSLWGLLKTVLWRQLYCVFTYINSLLIDKMSVSIKTHQLSSHIFYYFICVFHLEIYLFFL